LLQLHSILLVLKFPQLLHQVLRAKEIADSLGLDATNTQDLQAIHNKYGEK
jgi:hypothetical protein